VVLTGQSDESSIAITLMPTWRGGSTQSSSTVVVAGGISRAQTSIPAPDPGSYVLVANWNDPAGRLLVAQVPIDVTG
jgi:hypothetical protein